MRDQDAERLRALLTAAAPDGPDDPGRAARVAARGRRDRGRVVTAGVIGVVAAAVIITPQVLNRARTSDLRNDVTNQPTATRSQQTTPGEEAMATTPCSKDPLAVPDNLSDQTISEDAMSIRLCPTASAGGSGLTTWLAPADALLTAGVENLIDLTAREPEVSSGRCDAIRVIPDPYVFLVGMPDGSVKRVFSTSACSDIFIGSTRQRLGADTVLEAFITALGAQRRSMTPPGSPPQPPVHCPSSFDQRQVSPVPTTRGPKLTLDSLFSELVLCQDGDEANKDVTLFNQTFPGSSRDLSTGSPDELDICPNADVAWTGGYAVTDWADVVALEFHGCRDYFLGHWAITANGSGAAREIQFLPDRETASHLGLP